MKINIIADALGDLGKAKIHLKKKDIKSIIVTNYPNICYYRHQEQDDSNNTKDTSDAVCTTITAI